MNVVQLNPKSKSDMAITGLETTFAKLPLTAIEPEAQVRVSFPAEELASLSESLLSQGQIIPVLVYWDDARGRNILIDGERRFRAAKQAELSSLDAMVFPFKPSESQIALAQLTIDLQRENFDAIERAKGFDRVLTANDWNATELARQLGKPVSTITRATDLLTLSAEFQEMITKGTLPTNIARELARLPEDKRADAWKQIQDLGLNGNGAQKFISKLLKSKKKTVSKKSKGTHTYNLSGFKAVWSPKKAVITPLPGKPKTNEQMLAALEQLVEKVRNQIADESGANDQNATPPAATGT